MTTYHIYNRGAHKERVFLQRSDYIRFLHLLYLCNSTESVHLSNVRDADRITGKNTVFLQKRGETLVSVLAYCLMPNHFHILIQDEGNIEKVSLFLQKLSTGYTMYYNKKYIHSGVVFQGKSKKKPVTNDAHFRWLFSYIHLNPLDLHEKDWKETGMVASSEHAHGFVSSYEWSSFPDMLGDNREQQTILDMSEIPEDILHKDDFKLILQQTQSSISTFFPVQARKNERTKILPKIV